MKVSKHSFVVVGTSSLLTAVTGGGRGSRITASLSWVQLALLKRKGGGGMVGPISRPSVGWRSQGYRCRGNRSCDSRRDTFHIPVARDRHNNNNAQKAMQFHGSCCRCLGFRSFFRVSFVQQYADPDVKDRIHHHTGVMIAIAIGTLGRSTISSWKHPSVPRRWEASHVGSPKSRNPDSMVDFCVITKIMTVMGVVLSRKCAHT